jgi:hypothetical protein
MENEVSNQGRSKAWSKEEAARRGSMAVRDQPRLSKSESGVGHWKSFHHLSSRNCHLLFMVSGCAGFTGFTLFV